MVLKSIIVIGLVISLLGLTSIAHAQDDKPLTSYADLVKEYVLNCNLDVANPFIKASCQVTLDKLQHGDCKSSLSYITIEACEKIDQYLELYPK
jgi:hypothetical protein